MMNAVPIAAELGGLLTGMFPAPQFERSPPRETCCGFRPGISQALAAVRKPLPRWECLAAMQCHGCYVNVTAVQKPPLRRSSVALPCATNLLLHATCASYAATQPSNTAAALEPIACRGKLPFDVSLSSQCHYVSSTHCTSSTSSVSPPRCCTAQLRRHSPCACQHCHCFNAILAPLARTAA